MQKLRFLFGIVILTGILIFFANDNVYVNAGDLAQQPTGSIPTVTGTPKGQTVTVQSTTGFVRVRTGPSVDFEEIGLLINGEEVGAIGQSSDSLWIKIYYLSGTGWVYSPLVMNNQTLDFLEPVGTPTPKTTPTIDPVLAAQFINDIPATRMPTYTAPAPLVIVTYAVEPTVGISSGFPMGLVILGLLVIGLFGSLIIYSRR